MAAPKSLIRLRTLGCPELPVNAERTPASRPGGIAVTYVNPEQTARRISCLKQALLRLVDLRHAEATTTVRGQTAKVI
jgi:hypothetical protein